MAEIQDPDDYEAMQRLYEAAYDDYLIDPEAWDRARHVDEPRSYGDRLRVPSGISRDGYSNGVFELTSPARCIKCNQWIPVGIEVVGRKHDGRWLIQHLDTCGGQLSARQVEPKSPIPDLPTRSPETPTPPARPLGKTCPHCRLAMQHRETLRFDHARGSFVHSRCLAGSE